MSDSMREQLLKAGFKETKKKKQSRPNERPQNRASKANNKPQKKDDKAEAERAAKDAIEQRKKVKASIKAIIEEAKLEKVSGEIQHSYVVGKRIKTLFVNEETRAGLISGEVVITRLNGGTFIVPAATGEQVQVLNPDWIVIRPDNTTGSDESDEYADYQVPDDLQW